MSEYVTVVSVDLQPKMTVNAINSVHNEHEKKSSFVTVLSINNNQNTTTISTLENPNAGEIVTVYRLPGERLGFGLKFQGGTKTNEKVQRLFIQSCDPESPASKARASWGPLSEGDEVLQIDNEPVTTMTRIECVKCLKDRNVAINLRVKKHEKQANGTMKNGTNANAPKKRPLPPPPPMVPPRKINKKPPTREQIAPKAIQIEIPTPVAAETYLNTLDDEVNRNDESDETGSTISSQISVISNFSSESDLSLMSTNASSSDLTKLLSKPFQMIEREFNVNVLPSTTSMSIDNLLMFNDSEPIEIDEDEKVEIDVKQLSTYENVDINNVADDEPRQYENIDIKLPPIPRPRSISLPQDAGEIDAKTPTKTIESWLNDANTINGNNLNGDKHASADDHDQNYEPIKFECFAAGEDEDDEKLGPTELLNISEAYFNFSWCGNATSNLATIGEAEEEFSSMEPILGQKALKGPIFIVNTVHDSESDNDGKNEINKSDDFSPETQRDDMEINNNNSLYLHEKCEDRGDNGDKEAKCENKISQSVTTVASGFSRQKMVENSLKAMIEIIEMEKETVVDVVAPHNDDSDESSQSHNDDVTQFDDKKQNIPVEIAVKSDKTVDESAANEFDNEKMIKIDSGELDQKCDEEMIQPMTPTSKVPLIDEQTDEITQLNAAAAAAAATTTTESKGMTSLPTPSAYQFTSDTQMEQLLPDRRATEISRMPPDGHEFPSNRMLIERHTKSDNTTIDSIKSPQIPTTKATAIVAPLVPRKMHQFDEITNFVDTKPPFKSATLGRQRPINWQLRNKDEKSEKSVKDKIAMFSNSTSDISHMLPKTTSSSSSTTFKDKSNMSHRNSSMAKSIENIFSSSAKSKVNGCIKKKAMSVENLDDYDDDEVDSVRDRRRDIQLNYKPVSKPASLHSSPAALSTRTLTLNIGKAQSVENLIEPCESPRLPSRPPPTVSALSRRISFSGYSNNQMEENHQKSMTNIIETRKKSMSKLRGLVIPEKVPENEMQPGQKVFGLPVIRSKECDLINGTKVFSRSVSMPQSINITPAKKSFAERKSGFEIQSQVKAAPRKSVDELKNDFQSIKSPPVKPPRTSLIVSSHSKSVTTDESDTESCLSSRVSSPPVSPVAKKPLTRTFSSETNTSISSNSTLTSGSGSQASCSSNGSTPDGRPNKSTEAVSSRKSILASSKSRSGRDCLEKSWRDEDSTDGGIDNDERRRVPKAKARNSLVNYKLVSASDNLVDKIINVATYVEVVSSDSDDKPEASEAIASSPAEKNNHSKIASKKQEAPQLNIMSDMAKWVRSEATKTIESVKKPETKESSVGMRTTAKVLEPPKKLNLSEIRKNFENKAASAVTPPAPKTPKEKPAANHNRFSSWDSVASSSSGVSSELLGTGTGNNNSESLQTLQSDFGSFSSFGSSHSLITPQDLQLIIDEADPPLETPEAFVVVLQRETPESSIGITLAGGSDYEAKEITIHRILTNSPADKDGRLKRGDRLLSINGLSMRGLTHRESLSVLKSPRADVVMVVTRSKSIINDNNKTNSLTKTKRGSLGSLTSLTEKNDSLESTDSIGVSMKKAMSSAKSMEMDLDAISNEDCSYQKTSHQNGFSAKPAHDYKTNDIDTISIVKDGAGLGFSIDGGYDSPAGNKPLIIKKIFMGGAAERSSNLKVGDEILEINGSSIAKQTRIDVWNMIKKLPQGDDVHLTIKRK